MTATEAPPMILPPTKTLAEVSVGDQLPAESIELTPTLVIQTAIASRDFEPVHHDVAAAQASGLDNVFLNILTTNGICQRMVTQWAGPNAIVRSASVRLGMPALAGDTLALSAEVTRAETVDGRDEVDVVVTGTVGSGRHCRTTVTIELPAAGGGR